MQSYGNGGPQVTCIVHNFSLHFPSTSTLLWLHFDSTPALLSFHNFIKQEHIRSGVTHSTSTPTSTPPHSDSTLVL